MDGINQQEEKLREAACVGDEDTVRTLIEKGVDIDSQNAMNGWTALHWAVKRGHVSLVAWLVQHGANLAVTTSKGETALQLADDPRLRTILGAEANGEPVVTKPDLPITPHYLAQPPFPYATSSSQKPVRDNYHGTMDMTYHQLAHPVYAAPYHHPPHHSLVDEELVLKARVANTGDSDFIEVELPRTSLTYEALLTTLCRELEVDKRLVQKLRKLPDTVLRKDKDVKRLCDLQELELVLTSRAVSQQSRNYGGPSPRHIDVVY